MPALPFFGLRQRGEAAQGSISPQLHYRILELRSPVREGLKAINAYDTALTRYISRKLNETSSPVPEQDDMRSASSAAAKDEAVADSTRNNSPIQSQSDDVVPEIKPAAATVPIEPTKSDLAGAPDPEGTLEQEPRSRGSTRHARSSSAGTPNSPRSMHSLVMVPLAINRLSRSNGGLKRRNSLVSTIRSSYPASLWDNESVTSVATTANGWMEEFVTVAPSEHRASMSKKIKLSRSPSDFDFGSVDGDEGPAYRHSYDGSMYSGSDSSLLLREAISPSSYEPFAISSVLPNPEIHGPTESDMVEGKMQGLTIDSNPQNLRRVLSIISEGCSDAGNSNSDNKAASARAGGPGLHLTPPTPNTPELPSDESFTTCTSAPSVFSSRGPADSVIATSVEDDDSDHEQDADSMSSYSDDAGDSITEALNGTSAISQITPEEAYILWSRIMEIVESRVTDWMRSCPAGSARYSDGGTSLNARSGADSSGSSPDQNRRGTKRSYDDDETSSPNGGGGGGDEDPKRRRSISLEGELQPLPRFLMCPFAKRYTDMYWPHVCRKGFSSASRVKEHIYRNHTLKPHCGRCFREFKTDLEVQNHLQEDTPCERGPRPPSRIDRIGAETKKRLKSRKGIQNQSERTKWNGIYEILFPAEAIPSPYVDDEPPSHKNSSEIRDFRQQTSREIEKSLRMEQGLPDGTSEVVLRLLERAFDKVLYQSTAFHEDEADTKDPTVPLTQSEEPMSCMGGQFSEAPTQVDASDSDPLTRELADNPTLYKVGDTGHEFTDMLYSDKDLGHDGNEGSEWLNFLDLDSGVFK